jgi:hypothetical protein
MNKKNKLCDPFFYADDKKSFKKQFLMLKVLKDLDMPVYIYSRKTNL